MREIGSEFWEIPLRQATSTLLSANITFYLSGRIALAAIIRDIQNHGHISSISLPSYCCDSVILPFLSSGIDVSFYDVTLPPNSADLGEEKSGLAFDWNSAFSTDAVVLMENYFGYNASAAPAAPDDYNGIVIRDLTHSVFSKTPPAPADYYFGSLRKWCGFLTGGFAWKKDGELPEASTNLSRVAELRRTAMQQKREYLEGKRSDKGFLGIFNEAEELLDKAVENDPELLTAEQSDFDALKHLDTDFIRDHRKENAKYLLDRIERFAQIKSLFPDVADNDVPLFVPVIVESQQLRDDLRRYLISHNIYCPIHWPVTQYQQLNPATRYIYDHELSVVGDQRYDLADMNRIVNTIEEFFSTLP